MNKHRECRLGELTALVTERLLDASGSARLRERLGIDPTPLSPIQKRPRQRGHKLFARLRDEERLLIENWNWKRCRK